MVHEAVVCTVVCTACTGNKTKRQLRTRVAVSWVGNVHLVAVCCTCTLVPLAVNTTHRLVRCCATLQAPVQA